MIKTSVMCFTLASAVRVVALDHGLSDDPQLRRAASARLQAAGIRLGGSECNFVDFEGLPSQSAIGTVSGTPNVTFGPSWIALIDADEEGGGGNFANEPSSSTIAFFLVPVDPIDFDVGVQSMEVFYVADADSVPVTLRAWDGPGGTGNLVDSVEGNTVGNSTDGADCTGDPTGDFCLWDSVTLTSATNNIRSITLEGAVENFFGFDDMIYCTGTLPVPELAFAPSALAFGEVEVGTTSPAQSATLTNAGDADATGLGFSLTGDSGYIVDSGACGDTLPAGGECEVVVTFGPDLAGGLFATLEVTSDESSVASLFLSGTGVGEALQPIGLTVDATPLLSDGNQVFEPGECVEVAPTWLWLGTFNAFVDGGALAFGGPEGPAYDLIVDSASYGVVEPGGTGNCREGDSCYAVQVGPSGVTRPATHWDATLAEELSSIDLSGLGGEPQEWTLHIGESFVDVPRTSPFYRSVETLLHRGVSGGCTGTEYCLASVSSRAEMPVFVLKALEGPGYAPGACAAGEEVFDDVPATSLFCPWIEELAGRGVVAGCGGGSYCPGNPVTRAQMAIFLLKTLEGASYTPPPCAGLFSDVNCPSAFADWIEELFARGVTGGCGGDPPAYCPSAPINRAQMAVFVTRTFGLALYGP